MMGTLGPQAQHPLELGLIHRLAGEVVGAVIGGQIRVGGGIIALHIDAVEDTVELVVAGVHDALHTVGEVAVLELLGVGGRHGGHRVGGPLAQAGPA